MPDSTMKSRPAELFVLGHSVGVQGSGLAGMLLEIRRTTLDELEDLAEVWSALV